MIIYGGKRTGPHGSRRDVFNSSAEVSLSMPCLPKDMCVCMLSHFSRVWLCATLWTAAHQVPLSMEFSRQESWSGFSCPPPGDLPEPGIEPMSLMSNLHWQTGSLPLLPPGKPKKVCGLPQADSLLIVLMYLQLTITAGNSRRTEKNQSKWGA